MKEFSDQAEKDIDEQIEKLYKDEFNFFEAFYRCKKIGSCGPIIIALKFDPIDEDMEPDKYLNSSSDTIRKEIENKTYELLEQSMKDISEFQLLEQSIIL